MPLLRGGTLRANGCASGGGGGGDPHQNFTGYTMRACILLKYEILDSYTSRFREVNSRIPLSGILEHFPPQGLKD
jgi:hypothetical protein